MALSVFWAAANTIVLYAYGHIWILPSVFLIFMYMISLVLANVLLPALEVGGPAAAIAVCGYMLYNNGKRIDKVDEDIKTIEQDIKEILKRLPPSE